MESEAPPRAAQSVPCLQVAWEGRWAPFWECLHVLFFSRAKLPAELVPALAFRDVALCGLIPGRALALSLALHVLLLFVPLPRFLKQPPKRLLASTIRIEYDLRWTPSTPFLPAIGRKRPPEKRLTTTGKPKEALPAKGADAFNPQTIVSNPPQPNQPRQTLLTQFAADTLRLRPVQLPNIVIPPAPQQVGAGPAAPPLAAPTLTRLQAIVPLPAMKLENLYPRLAVNPQGTTKRAARVKPPELFGAAVSGIAGPGALAGVVALSAQPARPTPVLEIPETRLRARFTAGPQTGGGTPSKLTGGEGGEPGGVAAGGAGEIELRDIIVSGGRALAVAPVIAGPPAPPSRSFGTPAPREQQPPAATPAKTPEQRAQELLDAITPGTRPGAAGRFRRVYTTYINMPNLTSQSGSWVLRFSELNQAEQVATGGADDDGGIAAPQAMKKVDPRYPASARQERIEGTVLLYAVIRSDGEVTDVAVVQRVDAQLEQSAVEAFRRWRFQPGTKNGHAIALEVLIEIPFRLSPLL